MSQPCGEQLRQLRLGQLQQITFTVTNIQKGFNLTLLNLLTVQGFKTVNGPFARVWRMSLIAILAIVFLLGVSMVYRVRMYPYRSLDTDPFM